MCSAPGARWLVLAALGSFVLFVATAAVVQAEPPEPADRSGIDAEAALAALKTALPAGWTIVRTARASIPDGWVSTEGGGLLVEGANGAKRFRTWFVPRQWIGISPRPEEDVLRRHGSSQILIGKGWKAITLCDDHELVRALPGKIGLEASLLVGGGNTSREIYGARAPEADALARKLIDAECVTAVDRDGAVVSLLVLGVPAPSLFRDAAARGRGVVAEYCASTLDQFPGKETVETLSRVVAGSSDDKCVNAAAMALEQLADPASGPSLMEGLTHMPVTGEAGAVVGIVRALGRIRWKGAGAALLKMMRAEESELTRAEYAKALASIRYEPAIPDLRAVSGEVEFTAEWIFRKRETEYLGIVPGVALLRMTGAWGAPADGARLALLPPKAPEMGKSIVMALVIESVGDVGVEFPAILKILNGTAFVDGVALPFQVDEYRGPATLAPNEVTVYERDITKAIKGSGKHSVRYQAGKFISNEIDIEVREAAK